jgi:2-amino-4-hydroxy-6-hydroxymethyldihydropteridine diphosphokinase
MSNDYLYLIALGSNKRHPLIGYPSQILEHAIASLEMEDVSVFDQSSIIASRPIGPSQRRYANSAAILASPLVPNDLFLRLKQIEHHFGRVYSGQKWRQRTLDLDIILWTGGIWTSEDPALSIPHPHWKSRNFVLAPAAEIAGEWRDPITGLTIRQLFHRFMHPKPLDRRATRL